MRQRTVPLVNFFPHLYDFCHHRWEGLGLHAPAIQSIQDIMNTGYHER